MMEGADDVGLVHRLDFVLGVAEHSGEYVLVMLTHLGRAADDGWSPA